MTLEPYDIIRRELVKRLTICAIRLNNEVKKVLSVPATRRRVRPIGGGPPYYRATTPAIKGAPPRKLSGRLRAQHTFEVDAVNLVARVGTNVKYARAHEGRDGRGPHPYLHKTLNRLRPELEKILSA